VTIGPGGSSGSSASNEWGLQGHEAGGLWGSYRQLEAAGRQVEVPLPAALRAHRLAACSRWPCALDEAPAAAGGWKAKYKAGCLLLLAPGLEELLPVSPGDGS
jgi:hypothetical protein